MNDHSIAAGPLQHSHSFLGTGHAKSERKTWAVIWLCGAMMVAEIVGGLMFGSIALVADGLHMGTHVAALAIAGLAYLFARRHMNDARFTLGTGKFVELARLRKGGFVTTSVFTLNCCALTFVKVPVPAVTLPVVFTAFVRIAGSAL